MKLAIVVAAMVPVAACSATTSTPSTPSTPAGSSASAPASEPKNPQQLLGEQLRAGPPKDVQPVSSPDGLPTVLDSINTTDKVVFMTIDDGYSTDPGVAALLKATGIPVTSFLTANTVRDNTAYFGKISKLDGQAIQNHSISHPQMPTLSESSQQEQLCATSADLQKWYGTKPWMFRPPYGEYNDTTRSAAKACGINYLVLWNASLPGDLLRYQNGNELKSGDIILTHWRDDLAPDLLRTLQDINAQGFKIAALQDYLPKN